MLKKCSVTPLGATVKIQCLQRYAKKLKSTKNVIQKLSN